MGEGPAPQQGGGVGRLGAQGEVKLEIQGEGEERLEIHGDTLTQNTQCDQGGKAGDTGCFLGHEAG